MEERNIYGYDPQTAEQSFSLTFTSLMTKVYLWMTMALAITGMTAYYVATNENIIFAIINSQALFWGLIIAELAIVIILSARIHRLSFATAGIMFGVYSILNGITLSFIFLAYTMESIASTFFITAGTFGAMSLVGLFTRRSLGAVGRFCFMALIGIIIASIVNMFVGSSTLGWFVTYAGVLIFCGLTAYDTQKMKEILVQQSNMGNPSLLKVALMCSLSLYLDFINLFLHLLRIFGDRR